MIKIKFPKPKTVDLVKLHFDALLTGAKEAIKPGTITIEYPRERRRLPDNFRGYILFSPENCISCFQCSFVCPANAILMTLAPNNRYYPSIDYAKCIFCHYCVDSCPGDALRPTKIHDVVYKDMEDMFTKTEKVVTPPQILREDKYTVEYIIDDTDLVLRRIKEVDNLIPEAKVREKITEHSVCIKPESCLSCALCVNSCPSEAIELSVGRKEKKLRINRERCTGCGICVKICPVQILELVREG